MHQGLRLKIFGIIGGLALLLSGLFYYSNRTPSPDESLPKNISPLHPVMSDPSFKPEEIKKLVWQEGDNKEIFEQKADKWFSKDRAVDPWSINRRISIFSHLLVGPMPPPPNIKGHVNFVSGKGEIKGSYSDDRFVWESGPNAGKGTVLSVNEALGEVIFEGLWGYRPHQIKACAPQNVTKLRMADWSTEKADGQWTATVLNTKPTKANGEAVEDILIQLCQINVDAFNLNKKEGGFSLAVEMVAKDPVVIKKDGAYFQLAGYPPFKSSKLDQVLKTTNANAIIDPTLEEARIAVDRSEPQDRRIKAIRALRGNNSAEALKALKDIVFEDTDIDLYRYEAVDTLAATGTKASFKIILDRLTEVGRSGYELRLARALAGGMGGFFNADEKTPAYLRKPEVDKLIEAARKNPPGK